MANNPNSTAPRLKKSVICHCGKEFKKIPQRATRWIDTVLRMDGWNWMCKETEEYRARQSGCKRILYANAKDTHHHGA